MLLVILLLLSIAVPVIAIVALVMAITMRERLRALELNVKRLEWSLAGAAAASPPPRADAPTPEPSTTPTAPTTVPPAPQPAEPQPAAQADWAAASAQTPESPAASPTVPPPRRPTLEERFGTQWTVWIGGVAIALGGFFLVRLSIEQGWFGPGVRTILGALLGIALVGAGEWARRTENLSGIPGLPAAHIPSVLTAAGTAIAFADVWAAYALHQFIGAPVAFALLAVVALATLAAALLHGPALAGLGLVGAFVTPLIVASDQPNYWALYLYLGVVTAAAFALARARMWRWLAVTAIVFGMLWTLPGLADARVDWLSPHDFHVVIGFVLVALLIVSGLLFGPQATTARIEFVSSAGLAAYLLASTLIVLASGHDPLALTTFTALVVATIAISWHAEAATAAVPAAAVLMLLVFADWALKLNTATLVAPSGPTAPAVPEPQYLDYGWHLALGALFATLFAVAGFLAQGRSERASGPILWSAAAAFAPIAILIALYYRIAGFDRSVPFAGVALLLAVLFAYATEALGKRQPRPGMAASGAIFATGTVAALALALTMTLERGWLTIGLALMVPGIAWISDKRPLPALRWLAAAILVPVLGRIAWQPLVVGDDVGTTPVFNWLLYGYGIPAAAFWLAGHLLRRRADDVPTRLAESAALLFSVLLVFLEIRHAMTGGDVYGDSSGLAEVALHLSAGLAIVIGLEHLRQYTHSPVHTVGALAVAALTLLGIVFGLLLARNPFFTGEPVGGPFVNLVLLGYGLPAALAAALALKTRSTRPRGYSVVAAVVAVVLAISYLSLEVRTLYQGPLLSGGITSDAEQYTYSATWLVFGVVLLAVGAFLRSQPARIASAAVLVLTVLKVFLIDMHDLSGIFQALSFIGLGLVLLGIGRFYQRLLFPRRVPAAPQPA